MFGRPPRLKSRTGSRLRKNYYNSILGKMKIFGGRATYGIILGQVINTWKDGCGGDRDHSFVLERVGQVRLGRALPGHAKSAEA